MATQKSEADPRGIVSPVVGEIDEDDITQNVEVPFKLTDGVRQINTTVHHPSSDRRVRRMVVHDSNEERAKDLEVGLVDGEEVYRREWGSIRFLSNEMVYVVALDEAMSMERYAELVGFDEPSYKLGPGFETAVKEHYHISPV